MNVHVVVLNGGSSSGKSSLATYLQQQLEGAWLTLGIDDLIQAMSHGPADRTVAGSMEFRRDGSIAVAEKFREAQASWYKGLAAIARAGTGVIIDEVFLDGGQSQARLCAALKGLDVLWVGVRCDPVVAERRELKRPDRVPGLAKNQAQRVHEGVSYDIEVDTSHASSSECAREIVATMEKTERAP